MIENSSPASDPSGESTDGVGARTAAEKGSGASFTEAQSVKKRDRRHAYRRYRRTRKQRHTARRILARLADEHGRKICRIRRCGITCGSDERRSTPDVAANAPGAEVGVNFGEVWEMLTGVKNKMSYVHLASPALGESCAPCVLDARSGSVRRRIYRSVRRDRRCPDLSHQLRQFDQRSAEGDSMGTLDLGSRTRDGCSFALTSGSTRHLRGARDRRGCGGKRADSAETGCPRCLLSTHSMSSTRKSAPGTQPTTAAASTIESGPLGRTSQ